MSIKHCILHGLSQTQDNKEISLNLRETENENDGPIVSLFTQLKQSLQRSATRQYGQFDPEQSDNPLVSWLSKYNTDEIGFLSVTKKITEQLKLIISQQEPSEDSTAEKTEAFSAHLLFVVEELMDHQYLYIFWINHSNAQYIDSELNVDHLSFIDGGKINYVLKLDFSQWEIKDWQQYLTIQTSRGNKDLAHAFTKFTGFISGVNLQQQTSEFLNIVDQYADTLGKDETNPAKNAIVDYCVDQDMQGNPINFESLSQVLSESEPTKFSEFVHEHQETPQKEIYAHRNSLKKYVRFYGREKDLSISFSSDRMEDNIEFNSETGSLTFKQVPKSLQAQLAKYLKKQAEKE